MKKFSNLPPADQMEVAQQIAGETVEAYSNFMYSKSGWLMSILFLKGQGLSTPHVIGFMLSKHSRWAADIADCETGTADREAIMNYYKKYPNFFTKKALNDMI